MKSYVENMFNRMKGWSMAGRREGRGIPFVLGCYHVPQTVIDVKERRKM